VRFEVVFQVSGSAHQKKPKYGQEIISFIPSDRRKSLVVLSSVGSQVRKVV
jgi:hypothetical protein